MSLNNQLTILKDELLKVCDNVNDNFVLPTEYLELTNKFPYITIVLGEFTAQNVSRYFTQNISIIGIIKEEEQFITEKLIEFEQKVFNQLYKNTNLKLNVINGSNNNLFQPFGLEAGLYLPFAGFRMELQIPFSFER